MRGPLLAIAAVVLAFVAGSSVWAQDEASSNPDRPDPPPHPVRINDPPGPPSIVPRNPRVLVIMAANSERSMTELIRLRGPKGAFTAMSARGWKIGPGPDNHVQIIDRDQVSELLSKLTAPEFPVVVCVNDGEIVRSFKDGCTTPLDAWTFGWLLTGKNERPAAVVAEPARVASTGSYRLRGNHWSIDGDWNPSHATVLAHLRSPAHAYRIAYNWRIESWSYEELRSLHDDLHEQEQASQPATSRYSSNSTSRSPKNFNANARP